MRETEEAASLHSREQGLLWHPYGALADGSHFAVSGATGPRVDLVDRDGATLSALDGMSSWWSVVHGYRNPVIDDALARQLQTFSHVMFGGLTHAPAVELAERLVAVTPSGLDHVFLADSGSVSIEVALKLAVQYQQARGRDRGRFLALRGAYHGDTTGAMSVCDPIASMHADFHAVLRPQVFAPLPPAPGADDAEVDQWCAAIDALCDRHGDELAGIIVEPLFQGAGGMRPYHVRALQHLHARARDLGAVFIADEIATGFGRTGTAFACDRAGITPDIMCLGKALTGGYMTLAALMCTGEVAEVISESSRRALMHGPTFMANPLACTAASASLDLLFAEDEDGEPAWAQAIARLNEGLRTHLRPAEALPGVADVRVVGGIGVLEMDEPVDIDTVTRTAAAHGVWLRPFRTHIYTMPPYIATSSDVAQIANAMVAAAGGRP
ncbi:adenosylmethionine--8-amino-7-oxononanoate transaminase [Brevibacterium casei]|uniref:Adenosylmethionine-8-amino-7-oxononanoate aminotransferase n=1 Tax=Brevibacterium casei CIP 102111 TaxID=1255625 RepID=A0A2H1IGI5_9MICO|nr:adenosylmethionine--8-amino-7-oxononanoate transaminase [Brevibacterium casei]QPR40354.1 adenosylmethionine--8-amino-7-oxononanoate transaminase [Brevibacterium casei]QPR44510.1 adenosylmethionine--8-amino-7-oxononanoate transaminase [Brevibacterium casei]SMX74337.1 adenosylmethionine-8-amino-7-oxononanoate aminotransferase [Brevibacterium casei CIP 102111]